MNQAMPLAIVLVVLLAGCSGGKDLPTTSGTTGTSFTHTSSTPTSSTDPTTGPTTGPVTPGNNSAYDTRLPLFGCYHVGLSIPADNDAAKGLLPSGYTGTADGPVTTVGLDVFDCESGIVDNETIVTNPSIAITDISVTPPANSSEVDGYAYELVTNSPAIAERLREAGFEVIEGEITVDLVSNGQEVVIHDGSADMYSVSLIGDEPGTNESTATFRFHQATVKPTWMDAVLHYAGKGSPHSASLTADGHVLGSIVLAPLNPSLATGSLERLDLELLLAT